MNTIGVSIPIHISTEKSKQALIKEALYNNENNVHKPIWSVKSLIAILSAYEPQYWGDFEGEILHVTSQILEELEQVKADYMQLMEASNG